jgi:hypothetical protein
MYVCVHVFVYVCMYVCMLICMYLNNVCMSACMYACVICVIKDVCRCQTAAGCVQLHTMRSPSSAYCLGQIASQPRGTLFNADSLRQMTKTATKTKLDRMHQN